MRAVAAAVVTAVVVVAGCDKVAPPGMGRRADSASTSATAPSTPAPSTTSPAAVPAPAAAPAKAAAAPADDQVAEFLGLRAPKPATWIWKPPINAMRAANYTVPGVEGADAAELIVFFFGPGQGGTVQANIDRWAGQFRTAAGEEVEPILSEREVDGMSMTLCELAGHYTGMDQSLKSDQLFLAAIVDAPAGRVFIRLLGPSATVEAGRSEFMAMIEGLERADDGS